VATGDGCEHAGTVPICASHGWVHVICLSACSPACLIIRGVDVAAHLAFHIMAYEDPLWPRAATWLGAASGNPSLRIVGVPSAVASITSSDAHLTPGEVRRALAGFSTFDGEWGVDFSSLPVADSGDWEVAHLGVEESQARIFELASGLDAGPVHAFLGGDNAITRPLVAGIGARAGLDRCAHLRRSPRRSGARQRTFERHSHSGFDRGRAPRQPRRPDRNPYFRQFTRLPPILCEPRGFAW